jgi:hypothetical protein
MVGWSCVVELGWALGGGVEVRAFMLGMWIG